MASNSRFKDIQGEASGAAMYVMRPILANAARAGFQGSEATCLAHTLWRQ